MLVHLGVCANEALVTADETGDILVPINNYQGLSVHMEAGTQLGS